MADEQSGRKAPPDDGDAENREKQVPEIKPMPAVPEIPKLDVKLPPLPKPPQHVSDGGGFGKVAIAFTAASSFIMPIIVLSVGGWFLDTKFHTNWIAFVGVLVGLVVGITTLLRVIERLSDEPKRK